MVREFVRVREKEKEGEKEREKERDGRSELNVTRKLAKCA